jgi:hypothetical protein
VFDAEPAIVISQPLYSPNRDHEWVATRDSYEGGDPIGYGATPEDAHADLLDEEDWRRS